MITYFNQMNNAIKFVHLYILYQKLWPNSQEKAVRLGSKLM